MTRSYLGATGEPLSASSKRKIARPLGSENKLISSLLLLNVASNYIFVVAPRNHLIFFVSKLIMFRFHTPHRVTGINIKFNPSLISK